jgi:hypothetical protein
VPARLPAVGDANHPGHIPSPAEQQPRRFQAEDRPDPRQDARPGLRPNELPSARFAHPEAGDRAAWQDRRGQPGPRNDTPRPGVSFIPSAEQDRARAATQQAVPPPRNLPDVPRYDRRDEPGAAPAPEARQPRFEQPAARPSDRPPPAQENPAPRDVERFRQMRQAQPSFRPERSEPQPQPRIERAPPQPMPQPALRESRPAFERPSPPPAPRNAPEPRPQNPPAQGQNRGGEHRPPHGNRDEKQN